MCRATLEECKFAPDRIDVCASKFMVRGVVMYAIIRTLVCNSNKLLGGTYLYVSIVFICV